MQASVKGFALFLRGFGGKWENNEKTGVSEDSKIAETRDFASDSLQILYLLSQYLRPLSKIFEYLRLAIRKDQVNHIKILTILSKHLTLPCYELHYEI